MFPCQISLLPQMCCLEREVGAMSSWLTSQIIPLSPPSRVSCWAVREIPRSLGSSQAAVVSQKSDFSIQFLTRLQII